MAKLLVFIDHDLIVRHFLKSGILQVLEQHHEVKYVLNWDGSTDKRQLNVHPSTLIASEKLLIAEVPRARMGRWYPLYLTTALRNQMFTRNFIPRLSLAFGINGALRPLFHMVMALPGFYSLYRRRVLRKLGLDSGIAAILDAEKPDVVVYPTLLAGSFINELLQAKERFDFRLLALMNSWDNPSQKALSIGEPDILGVWGAQTEDHARRFLGLRADQIAILGAAQFQVYRRPVPDSRQDLCEAFNVPKDKRILLYAGVSKSVNETHHLRILDNAIANGVLKDAHIVYRPHPWRGGLIEGEEDFFLANFKHVTMDPHMEAFYRRKVAQDDPTLDMSDYYITHKLLTLVDGTISFLSTILVETLLHGKPVIPFVDRKDMFRSFGRNHGQFKRLAHFERLWGKSGVLTCDDEATLVATCQKMLDIRDLPDMAEAIQADAQEFADMSEPPYAERLVAVVAKLAAEGRPRWTSSREAT